LNKKIAIIGSGLGAMSAAIRLAVNKYDVHIFEQNSLPGGKAGSLEIEGFRFDTGPSLITMPFVINELFEYSGEKPDEYYEIDCPDILCKYFFADGTTLNAYSNLDKFSAEIEAKTGDNSSSLKNFLAYCRKIYDLTADIFLFNSLNNIRANVNLKTLKTLFQIHRIDSFRSMNKAITGFFSDSRNIQIFNRYATYNGSNPFKAPATLNIISHVELNLGGYYIKGGMFMLCSALYKLAVKKGVSFHFNTKVEKILLENGNVKGITTNDGTKYFDIAISNADVSLTYSILLDDSGSKPAKRYSKLEPSSSAIVFYWGVKIKSQSLVIHNILFSENYEKEFRILSEDKTCPDDPTVYIYISSKFNSKDAPEGCENWFVMINTPYDSGQDWETEIKKTKKNIIQKINKVLGIELNKLIVSESILSPPILEKINGCSKGSIYGYSSNSRTAAFLRHSNKSHQYKNLYFCGGSVHPGGGIPLVILSGKLAAEAILKRE